MRPDARVSIDWPRKAWSSATYIHIFGILPREVAVLAVSPHEISEGFLWICFAIVGVGAGISNTKSISLMSDGAIFERHGRYVS